MQVSFWKYHGLGNDFVIVDARQLDVERLAKAAPAICERHRGVGADGVLLWVTPTSENAQARMLIFNADGSRPEMCGNGLRCFVRCLVEQGLMEGEQLCIDTDRGPLDCSVFRDETGQVETIQVDMGAPILACEQVPIQSQEAQWIEQSLVHEGRSFVGTAISMGNPHYVIFEKAGETERLVAPALENHAAFPQRVNVEFVEQRSRRLFDVVVYERGCGFTQACGTGACAVLVAAVLTKRADADVEAEIVLPGGSLWIRVPSDLSTVWMRGAATYVFEGSYLL